MPKASNRKDTAIGPQDIQTAPQPPGRTSVPETERTRLPARRAERYQLISERLLEGVELGADALVESVRQGLIKGRDLAIVVGIMVDKLGALEDRASGALPAASVSELEKRVALLVLAHQELKRRQPQAIDVTPEKARAAVH